MTIPTRNLVPLLAAIALPFALTSCASGASAEERAQEVFDSCRDPDAEIELMSLKEASIVLTISGDDLSNRAVALQEITDAAVDCVLEESGHPDGSAGLLVGQEWDGWDFQEVQRPDGGYLLFFTAR